MFSRRSWGRGFTPVLEELASNDEAARAFNHLRTNRSRFSLTNHTRRDPATIHINQDDSPNSWAENERTPNAQLSVCQLSGPASLISYILISVGVQVRNFLLFIRLSFAECAFVNVNMVMHLHSFVDRYFDCKQNWLVLWHHRCLSMLPAMM